MKAMTATYRTPVIRLRLTAQQFSAAELTAQLLQAARPTALSKSHCPVLCKSHCPVTAQWDWDCQLMRKALRKLGLEPQCQYNAWQPAMTECPGTSASCQSLYPFLATVALPVWRAFLLLAQGSPRKLGAP